ncbi:DNA cytosine methyltransferase [Chelativorans sp. ZYF759]|nr:DNA cytosine methyltransferase [Chelativorans sp. ZYF759]
MRAVELFCGAGGMSLGLKRAGFEIIQAYDAWRPAVEAYRRNVGPHVWQVDLKDIFRFGPMLASLSPDMVVGGPPCQDFSSAGQRVERENAALTRAFAMLVAIARPEWFVMENVARASSSKAWADARGMLVKAGYGLTEAKLDASWYGVPQVRKRLFVIGRLGEAHGFLETALAAAKSPRQMTVRDMLGDGLGDAFYAHPRMPGKRGLWSADEPAPTMRASSRRPMPEGYRMHPDDIALLERASFFTRPYRTGRGVRTLDEPSPAIIRTSRERPRPHYLSSPHPADPVHPLEAAILTQDQVSRIQGFPPWWDWSGATMRDIDQMIANAVPAPLAQAIGSAVLARAAGETIPEIQGRFLHWLRKRGRSDQAARNVKSQVNRARRLLGGRTYADLGIELATLETRAGFSVLPTRTKSDLRAALRLHRDWLAKAEASPRSRGNVAIQITKAVA